MVELRRVLKPTGSLYLHCELLKCCDHRFEIPFSEVGPLVVMDSFVDGPLLHAGCAGRCKTASSFSFPASSLPALSPHSRLLQIDDLRSRKCPAYKCLPHGFEDRQHPPVIINAWEMRIQITVLEAIEPSHIVDQEEGDAVVIGFIVPIEAPECNVIA